MDELVKMAQYVEDYVDGIQRGFDKFVNMLPIMTQQHMRGLADERLHTTKSTFMGALDINVKDYLLVVELDEDDWLANAVETGADAFNMKETHLKSDKAKLSKPDKNGISYRYMRIPIGKQKNGHPGGTEKSQALQAKINQVMQKPNLGAKRLKSMPDGSLVVSQPVMSSDPDLSGLYQVKKYTNAFDYNAKKPVKGNLVMFRTISNNPLSKSDWEHPGIKPANIFRDTEAWLKNNIDGMLDMFIANELDKLKEP